MAVDARLCAFFATPRLLDGGMGTALIGHGLRLGQESSAEWNETHPAVVKSIHRGHVYRGAEVLISNTFSANRGYADSERALAYTRLGVSLARASAGDRLVAGCLGPPNGPLLQQGHEAIVEAYTAQAQALIEVGADLLWAETLYDTALVAALCQGLASLESQPLPVVLSFCPLGSDGSERGESLRVLCAEVKGIVPFGLGVNCSYTPKEMLQLVKFLVGEELGPVFVKPTPAPNGKRCLDSQGYADACLPLLRAGASGIGGCCGTSDDDLDALRKTLERFNAETPW